MEKLINKIKKKKENNVENTLNKSQEFVYYNNKKHDLFLRLKSILYNEKKSLIMKKSF